MEYRHAQSLIAKLARQIKWLSVALAGLFFCNALLGSLLWHQSGQQHIVLIPANLHQRARIMQHGVSTTYLEAMALMLVNDRLNITPQNVLGSNRALLTFVDPRFYAVFQQQLSSDARVIQEKKITSVFYVNQIRTNPRTLIVNVSGQLKRWVGERLISADPKSYQLKFSMRGHPLLLTAFEEIVLHKENT